MAGKVEEIKAEVAVLRLHGVFPAASFVVLENGHVSPETVLGDAEVGQYWDLASLTKVVGTGHAVLTRIFNAEIGIDDQLSDYLTSWEGAPVTIRELLTHHSGLDPYIPDRDKMGFHALKAELLRLKSFPDKTFRYSDVNFILLGFMLEEMTGKPLAELTSEFGKYGPVENAVATVRGADAGVVHDPKARVLGVHCGSAGLFSTTADLTRFVEHYFGWKRAVNRLARNYAPFQSIDHRSLGWDLLNDRWLLHTGYTGTFILMNLKEKKAVIFLSNRTFDKDERAQWIQDRNALIKKILHIMD